MNYPIGPWDSFEQMCEEIIDDYTNQYLNNGDRPINNLKVGLSDAINSSAKNYSFLIRRLNNSPLDRQNYYLGKIMDELGNLELFLESSRKLLDIDRTEILKRNMHKNLKEWYKNGN